MPDCHFKRHTRAKRGFFEDQREILARQREVATIRPLRVGGGQKFGEIGGAQAAQGQHVCILMHNIA